MALAMYDHIYTVELNEPLKRHNVGLLATYDKKADRFGAKLTREGAEIDVSGYSVWGYFIRPNGETVLFEGAVSDGVVYVELPENCYYHDGAFTLAVKIKSEESEQTVLLCDGRLAKTRTDTIVDNDQVFPSVESIVKKMEEIDEAIAGKLDVNGHAPNKYLGTDEHGNVVEKDAPTGGTGDGGGAFVVNVTEKSFSGGVDKWYLDKTFDEIKAAAESGMPVVCRDGNRAYYLTSADIAILFHSVDSDFRTIYEIQLESDNDYATPTNLTFATDADIPEKLPNPQPLRVSDFEGNTETYNGNNETVVWLTKNQHWAAVSGKPFASEVLVADTQFNYENVIPGFEAFQGMSFVFTPFELVEGDEYVTEINGDRFCSTCVPIDVQAGGKKIVGTAIGNPEALLGGDGNNLPFAVIQFLQPTQVAADVYAYGAYMPVMVAGFYPNYHAGTFSIMRKDKVDHMLKPEAVPLGNGLLIDGNTIAVDQEAIVQQVIAALGTPVFGRVDADNTIVISGNLADGTYTLEYEKEDGNRVTIGTFNSVGNNEGGSDSTFNVPITWQIGTKLSKTTGAVETTSATDYNASDFIPLVDGASYVIATTNDCYNSMSVVYYNDNNAFVGYQADIWTSRNVEITEGQPASGALVIPDGATKIRLRQFESWNVQGGSTELVTLTGEAV